MGCDNIRVHIVCRMLNRTKLKDLMVVRTDYDAARMLTRRPLYARTVLRKSVFLVFIYRNVSLFKIFRDIAVSGLFRYRAYGPRLENVFITENNADVFMRLRLVFACEIKVDIGLFVPFEAEEGCERNRVAVPLHRRSAVRTVHRRHIDAAVVLLHIAPDNFFAVRTQIVRVERIYLRDSRHRCSKG